MLSQYTGGINGWGTMICRCPDCGEIIAEFECDEQGRIVQAVFDDSDSHECEDREGEE